MTPVVCGLCLVIICNSDTSYNSRRLDELTEQIRWLYENPDKVKEIAERAWEKAVHGETWQKRVEELCRFAGLQGKAAFCK